MLLPWAGLTLRPNQPGAQAPTRPPAPRPHTRCVTLPAAAPRTFGLFAGCWTLAEDPTLTGGLALPFELLRPGGWPLVADALILLASIVLLAFLLRHVVSRPSSILSVALFGLFYFGLEKNWWATEGFTVDESAITFTPHLGKAQEIPWSAITAIACDKGPLFPLLQARDRLNVYARVDEEGREKVLRIPSYFTHYDDLVSYIQRAHPTLSPEPLDGLQ